MQIRTSHFKKILWISIWLSILNLVFIFGQDLKNPRVKFIDCYFEFASPLNWEMQGDTAVRIYLMYDYERNSPNRAAGHWYFKVIADPGTHLKLILSNMDNVWNGQKTKVIGNIKQDVACYISYDNKNWEGIKTSRLPGMELMVDFIMKGESVYIARIPPYTITDLEKLKTRISKNPLVKIYNIGTTVEGRPLEIIQLGNQNAPHSFIIRARAHSWESGGSWVLEGLINRYIYRNSKKWSEKFCLYLMPMANKDGVARGMTRFNVSGKDLNRNWEEKPDSVLCPEKFALEKFITGLIKKGIKPDLGIDLHNDDYGSLGPAPHDKNDMQFLKNMKLYEKLMRKYTSFSEEVTYAWKTASQAKPNLLFNGGLLTRYGIEAITYELNANWIGSLNKIPSREDYIKAGEGLNDVFYEYLDGIKK